VAGRSQAAARSATVESRTHLRVVGQLPPPARTLGSEHHDVPGILSCRVPAHDVETVMKPLLVMDDQDARRFANRCGLTVIGTLGILLAAKQRGAIASLRAEINALSSLGFRAKPRLVTAVLQSAGE
jgi:Domain of unknown function (DUF3368)